MCEQKDRELYARFNKFLLEKLSIVLNNVPDFITEDFMNDIMDGADCSEEALFGAILARGIGLDIDKIPVHNRLYKHYFFEMVHQLDNKTYEENPYYKTIKFPNIKGSRWSFGHASYKPYQAFVCNDFKWKSDGRVIPQIGFFNKTFSYPVVYENGREWMSVTPNEIETMQGAIQRAHGKVLTFGLGLGYFTFMASLKEDVSSVTVIERDEEIIQLFEKHLICQFPKKEKVHIIKSDAFDYAENQMKNGNFDYIYTDLWHDPSDGVALYKRMKSCERFSPQSEFAYWIEPTIRYYL